MEDHMYFDEDEEKVFLDPNPNGVENDQTENLCLPTM